VEPTRGQRFEDLFRETYPLVRAYALRRAAPEAAQDIVADTLLVAWRRFDEMPDDALPWLYGIARRVLANQRRSADRSAALEQRLADAGASHGPREVGENLADAELMRLAMGRLSDHGREALMLVAWHGLSGARAARAAGCSRAAFAVRLHRSRTRLAAELAALEGAPPADLEPNSLGVI
jgi:RNA polymerase sigma-70 factor (ECF subfamily)